MIVGLTSGTWDLFHWSHLHFLERCKTHCDRLIVGVDGDSLVRNTKGPRRPIFHHGHRLALINSLSVVDAAFILERIEDLTRIAYDFNVDRIFKCGRFETKRVFGAENAELVIIPDVPGMISTTAVIQQINRTTAAAWQPINVREP
jgi:D-beta-D-heptose 7-phosphate kinase/D-beta-D-heptose 1-phosphate adenosyltransferase